MQRLPNAMECCGCIYVASVNSGTLVPFAPVDPCLAHNGGSCGK